MVPGSHSRRRTEHLWTYTTAKTNIGNFPKDWFKNTTSKLQLSKQESQFLRHITNKSGISPDYNRIRTLKEQPPPSNMSEIRSFLDSVSYCSCFVQNLRMLCSPLLDLLNKGTTRSWTERHQNTFEEIRERIQFSTVLGYFHPKQRIVLACDSSIRGLCAVFQHHIHDTLKLITVISRTLESEQRNFSNIDRESTDILFGLQKFYKYLLVNNFIIQSSLKPLERILN